MPLSPRGTTSEKKLSANRANAARSTGPRTPAGKQRASLNALRHGGYARPDSLERRARAQGAENAEEYERLLAGLVEAWQPRNAMERLIVSDLASLYWMESVSRRACFERQNRQVEHDEVNHARQVHEARVQVEAVDGSELEDTGWRRVRDCPEKFEVLLSLLGDLSAKVKERDGSREPAEELFERLYGPRPTWLGRRIITLFWKVAASEPAAEDCERLQELISEERENVLREREFYEQDHAVWVWSNEDSQLAPLTDAWTMMLRQQTALGRQIAQKVHLLLELKKAVPSPAGPENFEGAREQLEPGDSEAAPGTVLAKARDGNSEKIPNEPIAH